MRISEIFLLENLSINVPYYRMTTTIVCLNFYSSNLSRFQYFDCKGNTHQGSFSKIRTLQITSFSLAVENKYDVDAAPPPN